MGFRGISWDYEGDLLAVHHNEGDRSFDFNQELTCFDLNRDFSEAFWMGEENFAEACGIMI
jgi:hypothetical protein